MTDDLSSSTWELCYQDALEETDTEKLRERVYAAEAAICRRWAELDAARNAAPELRAIHAALRVLLKIKTEKLKWPPLETAAAASASAGPGAAVPVAPPLPSRPPRPPLNYFKMQR